MDLLQAESFDDAKAIAESQGRWLLLNIQRDDVFHSHQLNRDLWSKQHVRDILKASFALHQGERARRRSRLEEAPLAPAPLRRTRRGRAPRGRPWCRCARGVLGQSACVTEGRVPCDAVEATTEEGRKVLSFYRLTVDDAPLILVIEPATGQCMRTVVVSGQQGQPHPR